MFQGALWGPSYNGRNGPNPGVESLHKKILIGVMCFYKILNKGDIYIYVYIKCN